MTSDGSFGSRNTRWRRAKPENAVSYQITNARNRTKGRGLEFNLKLEDLLPLPTHCPVFGFPLNYQSDNSNDPTGFSLDRIDNDKGYVRGNVIVVSLKANKLKRDASLEDLRQLLAFYEKFMPSSGRST